MTKPELFIKNSDYATLKNDGQGILTVTIPSGVSVGPGEIWSATSTQAIGDRGSTARCQIASSKVGADPYVGQELQIMRTGTASGSAATYTVKAFLYRSGANALTAQVQVFNPYSVTLTGASGAETFTFTANTFRSPFDT